MAERVDKWLEDDQPEEALRHLNGVLEANRSDVQALLQRGRVHSRMYQRDKARGDFVEAIILDGNNPDVWSARGKFFETQDFDRVVKDFTKALELDPKRQHDYLNRARVWTNLRKFEKAAEDYTAVLRLKPNDPHLFYLRGEVYELNKQFEKAADDFESALRLKPKSEFYFERAADACFASANHDRTIQLCNWYLKIHPNEPDGYFHRGLAWRAKKDLEKALKDFEEGERHITGTTIQGKRPRGYYEQRVEVLITLKKFDQALAECEAALKRFPEEFHPFKVRGKLWLAQGEFDKALQDFEESLRREPNAHSIEGGGLALLGKKDYQNAFDVFNRQLGPAGGSAVSFEGRGRVHLANRNYDDAIKDFNKAIEQGADGAQVYASRGAAWVAKGEPDKAVKDLNEAIRLDPENVDALESHGDLHAQQGQWDKALKKYEDAVRRDPKRASAFSKSSVVRINTQDYRRAIDDCDKAMRLQPTEVGPYWSRGLSRYALKEYDQAISDFDRVLTLEPMFAEAYCYRGSAWRAKKEYAKAVRDYDAALGMQPKGSFAICERAVTLMLERKPQAIAGFQACVATLDPSSQHALGVAILGHLAARLEQNEAAARDFLKQDMKKAPSNWLQAVAAFLRGELKEDEVLQHADDDIKRTTMRSFLGLHHAIEGRNDAALAHFRWVRDHGNTTLTEYSIAVAELHRLENPK